MKMEHIGIAVKDLAESERLFENLLQNVVYKREKVEEQSVITSFLKVENTKIELLHSTDDQGPISRFIRKHGEGIHHLAFEVDDILKEMDRLDKAGYNLLSDHPVKGADNKWVVFLHPKTTNGVLIELCQEIKASDTV